jgi:hypothetical protein
VQYSSNAFGTIKVKTEDFGSDAVSHLRNINVEQTFKGKRTKQERSDDFPVGVSQSRRIDFWENSKGKKLKQEYLDDSNSSVDTTWVEEKVDPKIIKCGSSNLFKANPCKSVDRMVAKPPYFFYGNTTNVPYLTNHQLYHFQTPFFFNTNELRIRNSNVSNPSKSQT